MGKDRVQVVSFRVLAIRVFRVVRQRGVVDSHVCLGLLRLRLLHPEEEGVVVGVRIAGFGMASILRPLYAVSRVVNVVRHNRAEGVYGVFHVFHPASFIIRVPI